LRHEVVARPRRVRAVLAKAGDRAIDQPRVVGCEAFVIEPELGQAADLEILDQHVGTRGEFLDNAAAVVALEIEFDRTLAAIGAVKIGGAEMAAGGGLDEWRSPGAGVIAGAFALDLDHVGAEIGEDLARPRPGEDTGKLKHAQTVQWTRH
jgi:hypothetical protein